MKESIILCPDCGKPALKAIYLGLPVKICSDDKCALLWGLFSFVCELHFNGYFFIYEESYFKALIEWLKPR